MCVVVAPAVAAGIAIASTVVSAGVSAYGMMQQAQAQKDAANYQAQVAKNNQIVANQNAQAAIQDGVVKEQQQRIKNSQLMGQIQASQGASGLDVTQGSNLLVQNDQAKIGELDALTIRNNAQREAYGYKVQGNNFQAQGQLAQMQGNAAMSAGMIGAAGSIVGSAGKAFGQYYTAKQDGAFD